MFRVPTDIKAGRAITINGQAYAKDARIEADDLATVAGRLPVYFSKGLLYPSPDPHGRKTRAGNRQPSSLPPVVLSAVLAQEVVQDSPGAPTGLAATVSDGEVSIAFTPHAGTAATTGYEYRMGTAAWAATVPPTTQSPLVVGGLTNGVSHTFRVRGVNKYGKGTQSDALVAAAYAVPEAPSALVATAGDESVSIAFTAGDMGGGGAFEYNLDGAGWLSTDPATVASPLVLEGLPNGAEVSVDIRATNPAGSSAGGGAVTATPAGLPGIPTALAATPSALSVSIAFTAASANGSAVIEYEYSFNDGTDWFGTTPDTAASPMVLSVPADDYTVILRAVNGVGAGAESLPVTFTVPAE